jgi:Ca2+-binding EF-hand superfamily protein
MVSSLSSSSTRDSIAALYAQLFQTQKANADKSSTTAFSADVSATTSTKKADSESAVKSLFTTLDLDADGSVSESELGALLNRFTPQTASAVLGEQEAGASDSTKTASKEPPSLEDLFAEIDSDDDGLLSLDELKTGMAAMAPPPPPPQPSSDELMTALDADQDGSISVDELTSALGDDEDAETKVADTFSQYDADGDGKISLDELTAGRPTDTAKAPPPAPPSADDLLTALDADEDGALSLDELQAALGSDEDEETDTSTIFSQLDTDQDGKISLEELQAAHNAAA